MKTFKILILVFALMVNFVQPVYAFQQTATQELQSTTACFDLYETAPQSRTVFDPAGNPAVITVIDISASENVGVRDLSNGVKQITYQSSSLTMSFKIRIINYKITSAYDETFSAMGSYNVTLSLNIYSFVLATLSASFYKYSISVMQHAYLTADISDGTLNVFFSN